MDVPFGYAGMFTYIFRFFVRAIARAFSTNDTVAR